MNLKELIFGRTTPNLKVSQYHGSTQKWLPVADIQKGVVITKDSRFVKFVEVLPVNFYLLSPLEQQNMIHYFRSYLKVAPDTLQILVVTQKADIESYIRRMRDFYDNEPVEGCRELIADNIREVTYLAASEAVTRRFFLVFQYDPKMKAREYLDPALVECYRRFGITFDNASLHDEDGGLKPMPDLHDLYDLLREQPETKSLAVALARFATGSAANMGRQTNVDLHNKYIVLDISELPSDLISVGMFMALDFCWDKCKESRVENMWADTPTRPRTMTCRRRICPMKHILLPGQEQDRQMISAIEIMRLLSGDTLPEFGGGSPPAKLAFYLEDQQGYLDFKVIPVAPGQERKVLLQLEPQLSRFVCTCIFAIRQEGQIALLASVPRAYFALPDGNGE